MKTEKIPLSKDHQIHIVEPSLITYMMTIVSDLSEMISSKTFPTDDYGFYYPQLTFHKVLVSDKYLPATIDLIASPFMIIKHGDVITYNSKGESTTNYRDGFVVYYNRSGDSDIEFLYLLDTLSKYQILDGKNRIRIRLTHPRKCSSAKSNFRRAIEKYAHDWGYDEDGIIILESIDFYSVPIAKEFYCTEEISWTR